MVKCNCNKMEVSKILTNASRNRLTGMPTIFNPGSNGMADSSGFQDCEGQNNSTLEYLDPSELNRCDEIDVVEIEKIEIKEQTLSNITDLYPSELHRYFKTEVLPTTPEERTGCHCDVVILVMCGVGMIVFIFFILIKWLMQALID